MRCSSIACGAPTDYRHCPSIGPLPHDPIALGHLLQLQLRLEHLELRSLEVERGRRASREPLARLRLALLRHLEPLLSVLDAEHELAALQFSRDTLGGEALLQELVAQHE